MKPVTITLIAVFSLAALVYRLLTWQPAVDDKSGLDMLSWPPNSLEMAREVGSSGGPPGLHAGEAARRQYVALFKKRYRGHTPMMAVGMRYAPHGVIDLLMPARMEPWSMDRLAVFTRKETEQVFGRPYNIDLYVTYIGAPPLKIGELRPSKTSPEQVDIVHYGSPIVMQRIKRIARRR